MRRALRRAVGVLLASGVMSLARPALAQTSGPLPPSPPPAQSPLGLGSHEGELSLPPLPIIKSARAQPPAAKRSTTESVLPQIRNLPSPSSEQVPDPPPAVKVKRSAGSEETEAPATTTSPRHITITPPASSLPTPLPSGGEGLGVKGAGDNETAKIKQGKPHKSDSFASDSAAPTHSGGRADAPMAPTPPMSWRRPGSWEASEAPAKVTPPVAPRLTVAPLAPANSAGGVSGTSFERSPALRPAAAPTPPTPPATSAVVPTTPAPRAASASRPIRRWPPAYDIIPARDEAGHAGTIEFEEGQPGTIEFEEEPSVPMASGPAPSTTPSAPPRITTQALSPGVGADNLKKQVQAVCGRQARDVTAAMQPDGSVLVTVKVTKAAEKQVLAKILGIPEMSSSKVRLSMELVP